jgi:hypothetical protein
MRARRRVSWHWAWARGEPARKEEDEVSGRCRSRSASNREKKSRSMKGWSAAWDPYVGETSGSIMTSDYFRCNSEGDVWREGEASPVA